MKAIIFGANGQDGYYLRNLLNEKGIDVIGISRTGNFLQLDITNYQEISTFINLERPEYIFHLAANSTTNHNALFENHQTIATGTLNILEAVKNFCPHTKVFISGSGLQFKNEGIPIKETDPFEANVKKLEEFKPNFITAYVHVLEQLARAAKQSDQGVWDFVVPLVRSDVRNSRMSSTAPAADEVKSATADYIRIATERLC